MFTILDDTNLARVTLNNPFTGFMREVVILSDPKSIYFAIMCFANDEYILPSEVETSVKYPEIKLS